MTALRRQPWPPAQGWQDQLFEQGLLCFASTPLRADNAALQALAETLGPVSLRAMARRSGLCEPRGVQRVCSLLDPPLDQFDQPLLSANAEAFPLHSDEAFLVDPCRWVMLQCWVPDPLGQGRTQLADSRSLASLSTPATQQALQRPLPYPCGRFPCIDDGGRLRFNRASIERGLAACGRDVQASIRVDIAAIDAALSERATSLLLQPGDLLLIDNWRHAHGRDAFPADSPRLLKRLRVRQAVA